jgi:hypothetical protein
MSEIHRFYTALIPDDQAAVDACFRQVVTVLRQKGYDVAFDDRAERCVESIARYMAQSCNGSIDASGFIARRGCR